VADERRLRSAQERRRAVRTQSHAEDRYAAGRPEPERPGHLTGDDHRRLHLGAAVGVDTREAIAEVEDQLRTAVRKHGPIGVAEFAGGL